MARVLLVGPPFSGHLHPLIAMARRLRDEHDVLVVSTEKARPGIEAAGLRAQSILQGADAAIEAIAEPPYAVRSNPFMLNRQLKANIALMPCLRGELAEIFDTFHPSLVIADFVVPIAGLVAKARGIPWWTSLPSPCALETADGPPAYLGGLRPLSGPAGHVRDASGRALVRLFKRAIFALYGRELAWTGLRSPYRSDGSEAVYSDERILVPAVQELEFAQRWPAAVRFVGPLYYSPVRNDASDAVNNAVSDGVNAVSSGPRVLVTLGTHLPRLKEAMAEATHRAARSLPHVTFHFTDGNAGSARTETDANFTRYSYVPYDAAIRRYDLVVHHGGTGIVNTCLRDGVPALVHPVDYDQFDVAARIVRAGVARRLRSAGDLASNVAAALNDTALHDAAHRFAEITARYNAAETIAEMVRDLKPV